MISSYLHFSMFWTTNKRNDKVIRGSYASQSANRDPRPSAGRMLGWSRVEQMHSDIGSGAREEMARGWRHVGSWDMMVQGSSLVVFRVWGWIWISNLEGNRADRLYRCSGPAGALMHTEGRFMALTVAWKDSPSWNFTCRQAAAMSGLHEPSYTRKWMNEDY